jgi:hypothetical protein
LSGDPVGAGAHLNCYGGGQYWVQVSGQSQARGQSLARLIRYRELGTGIARAMPGRVTFHVGK